MKFDAMRAQLVEIADKNQRIFRNEAGTDIKQLAAEIDTQLQQLQQNLEAMFQSSSAEPAEATEIVA